MRRRLTLAYASALAVGLCAYAMIMLAVLYRPAEHIAPEDARWAVLASAFTLGIIIVPAIAIGSFLARRELRALERERRFMADASHELRAPLAVIVAETNLALRRDRDPAEYRKTLQTIAEVAAEMETLTRNLLDAARSKTEIHAPRRPVDVGSIVENALERLQRLTDDKELRVQRDVQPGIEVTIDPSDAMRAIVAVLHNAIQHTPAGGLIRIEVSQSRRDALVRVIDSGPGFSTEALEHGLERFWRADSARSPGTGSGLGLSIARALLEAAGGRIELKNSARAGGSVTLRFPLGERPNSG